MLLDIVFSLDSVITAVGMVDQVWVMIAAVVISVAIMMAAAEPISAFVHRHPTVKMLALSFLLLIGMSLLLEGFGQHIPKGYIYFAMGFSVFVEMINLRIRARAAAPVHLRDAYVKDEGRSYAVGSTIETKGKGTRDNGQPGKREDSTDSVLHSSRLPDWRRLRRRLRLPRFRALTFRSVCTTPGVRPLRTSR